MPTPRLRTRLLLHFLVFSVLCLGGIVALSWHTHHKQTQAAQLSNELKDLGRMLHANTLHTKSFFLHDAQRVAFFNTGRSVHIDRKHRSDKAIGQRIERLLTAHPELAPEDSIALQEIHRYHLEHATALDRIVALLMERGMEDHGMEGTMRLNAHTLESSRHMALTDVLSLRRIEKDYIIRHQEKYVTRLNERIGALIAGVHRTGRTPAGADSAAQLLSAYRDAFNRIVELDRMIGVRNQSGLFARLGEVETNLEHRLERLLASNSAQFAATERQLLIAYLVSVGAFLLLSIASAFLLAHRIAGPIKALATSVHHFVRSDFKQALHTSTVRARDVEIKELAGHFTLLQEEIHHHIHRLNERVNERTQELFTEKERVQLKNNEITASLRYARGIQESMLNSSRNIADLLPGSFLLNAPRDIVGGDFIWTHSNGTGDDRRIYFAVADCTGHGVPASLMSVMCHHALNEVVKGMHALTPARILEGVNERFAWFFGNEHGIGLGDGMSISLCMFDPVAQVLTFAGSFQSIHVAQGQRLVRLKGDRIYIGAGFKDRTGKHFSDHEVHLEEGAMVYLFSDGFADQFGGEAGRKFNAGNFKKLLEQASGMPIAHQHKHFHDTFHAWKGPREQVDDVMVLGIRIARAEAAVERSAA